MGKRRIIPTVAYRAHDSTDSLLRTGAYYDGNFYDRHVARRASSSSRRLAVRVKRINRFLSAKRLAIWVATFPFRVPHYTKIAFYWIKSKVNQ